MLISQKRSPDNCMYSVHAVLLQNFLCTVLMPWVKSTTFLGQVITLTPYCPQNLLINLTLTIALCRDPSWTGRNMGGRVKNWSKTFFPNHRYCQLCLKSECKWCHMCVCSPFQVIRHILKFVNWLNN